VGTRWRKVERTNVACLDRQDWLILLNVVDFALPNPAWFDYEWCAGYESRALCGYIAASDGGGWRPPPLFLSGFDVEQTRISLPTERQ
jgi:hypothetical protein